MEAQKGEKRMTEDTLQPPWICECHAFPLANGAGNKSFNSCDASPTRQVYLRGCSFTVQSSQRIILNQSG